MKLPNYKKLQEIYGESSDSMKRFQNLSDAFLEKYHREIAEFFSAPGRTEIIGNHTDHHGGQVIAASIHMDTIGAAFPNDTNQIHITSEGYEQDITLDLLNMHHDTLTQKTEMLLAGIVEGVKKYNFKVSGFDAYVSSNVIAAAGVSSSASFEVLICTIINYFFNENAMSQIDYAKIGKYAENTYWKKASGMMDQMACAIGGTVLFDFSNIREPKYEKLKFSLQDIGYQLVIVNTGEGHANLNQEYSEIPIEMGEVARILGVHLLSGTNIEHLLSHCKEIDNDRAILRAMHFFEEDSRVKSAAKAIENREFFKLFNMIKESGASSWQWLQNCYSRENYKIQKVSLVLALSQLFLKKTGDGVCRVHGGGFAGVIMCIVPMTEKDSYVKYISQFVGRENVYPMNIRTTGAIHIPHSEHSTVICDK